MLGVTVLSASGGSDPSRIYPATSGSGMRFAVQKGWVYWNRHISGGLTFPRGCGQLRSPAASLPGRCSENKGGFPFPASGSSSCSVQAKTSGFPQALTESHQSGRVSTLAVVACPPSAAFKIVIMFVCKAWLGPEAVGNSSQPRTGNTATCWGGDKNSIR